MIRKVYPIAEIAKTRFHRYLAEDKRYLNIIKEINNEAKEILKEGHGWSDKA